MTAGMFGFDLAMRPATQGMDFRSAQGMKRQTTFAKLVKGCGPETVRPEIIAILANDDDTFQPSKLPYSRKTVATMKLPAF